MTTIAWADVLGASATETTLTIHTCPRQGEGTRKLRTLVAKSDDTTLLAHFAIATHFLARFGWAPERSLDDMLHATPAPRKCLVLINPIGGSGKSEAMFESVRGFFDAASIDVTTQCTEYAGHATEIGRTLDLTAFDFVVCVGGDGLASEVVQGLMRRLDWHDAIRFPFGLIPGGSGNGLTQSLTKLLGEAFEPENCAYLIVKGAPQPIDMMTARNAEQETFYSFLSLAWAFVADVDLESETYRFLGGARFTMASVAKILSWKRWHGTLSYLPIEADESSESGFWESNPTPSGSAPQLDLLHDISAPVPTHWKTIEGPYSFFWATSAALPSSDCHLAPGAHINDGYIHIIAAPENLSMVAQTQLLLGLDTGAHIEYPFVHVIKTRAYQLRRTDTNYVSIDGERLGGETIQVQMHKGLGRVMCLPLPAQT
ncbi:hypothetical protein SPRG_06259 [Saprolegnia parasitica CBS 223.65]|uniref:DAGKc domain-containing protein n=1 Tax=Saprolegnia parasitica (strain CBS 223.65) TaxID=695850 RepID=A0A067CGE1_SAPPC|nr:hypothetical protein SPRG_06259 [Saprolegnia parasitica CBS 223.65]KDO28210.1 hypothetical protein SPRG_06259 [Saprolegnia parasitica CBS 223.65]|eukprot:XP_012201035.1 hypothetical protein SPRG_06259 [Saprolegnia parasitica CBS 223.65]